jgi:uncharacterized protein (DUF1778 family)
MPEESTMTMSPAPERREARIGLRVGEDDKRILLAAAEAEHETLTGFVLDAARDRAERVLAEQRRIRVEAETYDAFVEALESAPVDAPRLRKLFGEPSPFDT